MEKKAVIIEDEVINIRVFLKKLSQYPDIEIIGEKKGLSRKDRTDVIFLDIKLADGTRFDIMPYVSEKTEIIFTTGNGNYAVQAFEIDTENYSLNPLTRELLSMATRNMESLQLKSEKSGGETKDAEFKIKNDQMLIKSDDEYRFVKYSDILHVVSAGGNYTLVHLQDKKTSIIRKTLKEWERHLPASQFIRVHRSCIINFSKIINLVNDSGVYFIFIDGIEKPCQVSRRHVSNIKKIMKYSI